MSSLHELMNYTLVSKYARWIAYKKRRETWKEAVYRVRNMMLDVYTGKGLDEEINWAYDMMLKKKVLGSQRALQFGGEPALKKNARIYNCVSSYCDRPRFFQECFWLLLCGCGTGFSVQKHHVNRLPKFRRDRKATNVETFVIPDTIEGWSDAIGVLITHYLDCVSDPHLQKYATCGTINFDYSKIRPAGSFLSSGVGKAPGPAGLKNAIEQVEKLLYDRSLRFDKLRPIDCYDMVMHISDAVLSGGVRRSATICLFSADDEDMILAKTGNWKEENGQRARSNNSAMLLRDSTDAKTFFSLFKYVQEHGEPGFIWTDDLEMLINPCAEIGMWAYNIVDQDKYDKAMETYDGKGYKGVLSKMGLASGWQGCNLSTINCATIKDIDDFIERGRAAAIIGTLQAGLTSFKYLDDTSESIFKREALLGVSMTGAMEKFDIVLDPDNQKTVAKTIVKTNKEFAKKIGINQAARTTCMKPEGTSSCLLGTSSSLHPHHSKRYLRCLQANRTENPYIHFKSVNPQACEKSVWSANDTDDVIFFPIEVPDGAKTKNQIPALELLKIVKNTQENWVQAGKNKALCTQPWLSHNVSNTITVQPDEWDLVGQFIYDNRKHFCGIALLPQSGDKDYAQAPFSAVYTAREIVREYGDAALWTSGLIEIALNACGNLWTACDIALYNKVATSIEEANCTTSEFWYVVAQQCAMVEKMHKFADKYFEGDLKRLTYCMKDVYNWKLYCDLIHSFKPVDYTTMLEEQDETKPQEEIACAGGACSIL